MERNPIGNDARKARRARRLGPDAACVKCGVKTPEALTVVERTMLEEHHVAGRANDDALTVTLCLNCHRIATEGQNVAGVDFGPRETVLERLAAVLLAVGVFLCQLGEWLQEWARRLLNQIAGLDGYAPGWREQGWARA